MRVRKQYTAWGLSINNAGRVPEDHIALELAFCVHLLQNITSSGCVYATAALTDFLDEHLLQWAEPCLRKASAKASQPFYRCLPLLCLDALQSLRRVVSGNKANNITISDSHSSASA